jgi:3-hydroxyisobutyrate dehydrogenase-like beta-hydroxyacid dehydrogenase
MGTGEGERQGEGRVALLGTGLLGTAMAEALLAREVQLTVWNRTAEKTAVLVAKGAHAAASPEDAVRGAARVHLVLSDDDAVDAVVAQVGAGLAPGAVLVDHSTTLPARTRARAERLATAGVAFLHAPVFMTPTTAREAKGMILASGPRSVFERVEGALRAMTGEVWWVGERADLAVCEKLFGNAIQVAVCAALADVLAMARAAGVEPALAAEIFSRYDVVRSLPSRSKKMARGDWTPSWTLAMARKDVRLMLETAGEGAPLSVLPGAAQAMDRALARGDGELDYGVLARPFVEE